jgi:hypothetical protein
LPIQGHMIAILGNNGIDYHAVTDQALGDNPHWQRRCRHAAFRTGPAGALLALSYGHEITGRRAARVYTPNPH